MTACFVDTFFFLALLNARDQTYQAKARAANRLNRRLVTSYWVFLELADHLCDARNRHLFSRTLQAVQHDLRYEIVPADMHLLESAIELYSRHKDKSWSLTDCTTFLIMTDHGITDALTADHHFEQAGFVALLK